MVFFSLLREFNFYLVEEVDVEVMFKKLQSHFKEPKGLIGKFVGKIMAFENKALNKWTIRQLNIRPGKNILEVGYGPGYAIDLIFKSYPNINIDGIDISEAMKEEASNRLAKQIDAEKVHLEVGDVSGYSFQLNHYDYIFSVNNYTLWEDKCKGLENLYNAIVSKGKIIITMQPRQDDSNKGQAKIFAQEIYKDLKAAGFRKIKVRYKYINPETAVSVIAIKPR